MEFYATLGEPCARRDVLDQLFQAGMTGLRVNLSHTSLSRCGPVLETLYWPAARAAGRADAHLILDLQGPELRVGELPQPVPLREREEVLLGEDGIPVPQSILETARQGQQISLDDGALLLEVKRPGSAALLCRVVRGGTLLSRKSLSLLGAEVDTPTLTPADLKNLEQAGRYGATHILQPFVRGRRDIDVLRQALDRLGLERVQIMAKIENRQGIEHLDEIIEAADQLCIARGDLGNSIPLWKLPGIQKDIARRCRAAGRDFCLVTQLLWSMEQRPTPTRAEVCDLYNGVLDGASSLMLTGETAAGKWPVQAMEYLVRTAQEAMGPSPGGRPRRTGVPFS